MNSLDRVKINTVDSVYDGDTFRATINSWPKWMHKFPFRLAGIDTPEKGWRAKSDYERALGLKAYELTKRKLTSAKSVYVTIDKLGKYGRALCVVDVDGENLNQLLIDAGLAYEYHGGKRIEWVPPINADQQSTGVPL